jgi:hypothetical protein
VLLRFIMNTNNLSAQKKMQSGRSSEMSKKGVNQLFDI